MSDLAFPVTVNNGLSRQEGNLEIAKSEGMSLNTGVDLPRSQTCHPMPQRLAGDIRL
jgi:hypothetical protein